MLVGVLFFCLETKEKIPKEKLKAALPEFDAPTVRPGTIRDDGVE